MKKIREESHQHARFTMIKGRRRIGKTTLLPLLNLQGKNVISAAPFRSRAGKNGGIQVDLLIQTDGVAYIVEKLL